MPMALAKMELAPLPAKRDIQIATRTGQMVAKLPALLAQQLDNKI
jgi:hypothetical protein